MASVNNIEAEPTSQRLVSFRDQIEDPYADYIDMTPQGADLASWARSNLAYSYRGFFVGGAGYAHNPILNRSMIVLGGNMKANEFAKKHCAEMFVRDVVDKQNINLAYHSEEFGEDLGRYSLIGVYVVATGDREQIRGVTGENTATLCMCSACTAYNGDNPNTLSISFPDSLKYYEVNKVSDMDNRRRELDTVDRLSISGIPRFSNFHNWGAERETYESLRDQYGAAGSPVLQSNLAKFALSGGVSQLSPHPTTPSLAAV